MSTCVYSYELVFTQPPPPSSRPPVAGYKVSQNITGNVAVTSTSDTEHIVVLNGPGVYLFKVQAFSVLGDGSERHVLVTG